MILKRGDVFYVDFIDGRGKRQRKATTATTKAQAKRLEDELKVRAERQRLGLEAHDRNPEKHTVGSLVAWHLDNLASTANGARLRLTLEAHIVGDFAEMQIDRVDDGDVKAFLDTFSRTPLRATGKAPSSSSVNRLRAYLSGVFSAAKASKLLIGENPVKGTKQRKVETPAPRALPAEVVLPLLAHATPSWRVVIGLAVYAGLRRSEIARLKWSSVDLVVGVIYVSGTKAKKARVVPIHDQLMPLLVAAKGGDVVVEVANIHNSAREVRRLLAAAGVVVDDGVDACFHSLRHTWSSQWVACGAPSDLVEWVGWGPRAGSVMQTDYLKQPIARLRAEMAKLSWPTSSTNVAAMAAGDLA